MKFNFTLQLNATLKTIALCVVAATMFVGTSFAQCGPALVAGTKLDYSIDSCKQIDEKTFQFDLFVKNISTGAAAGQALKYSGLTARIIFSANVQSVAGAAGTFSYVAGSIDPAIAAVNNPITANFQASTRTMILTNSSGGLTSTTAPTLATNQAYRIGTFRYTDPNDLIVGQTLTFTFVDAVTGFNVYSGDAQTASSSINNNCNTTARQLTVGCDLLITVITAVKLQDATTVAVYPNPFSDFIKFSLDKTANNAKLIISDATGREVFNTIMNGNEAIMNRNALPSGVYYYRIVSDDSAVITGKLVAW
jgi:hypothetical protein